MLKPISVQQLTDASQDATSLSEFIFKPADYLVSRRLSPEIHTLNHYLTYFEALKRVFTQPTGNVVVDGVTIPSLSQKLADFDSVINDNVATVSNAIITMQDVLTTVGSDAATAVDSAILGIVNSSGFVTVDSFEFGATITQRNEALRHAATGKLYRWAGDLPKVVPVGSAPLTSGGFGSKAWLDVSDTTLREELGSPRGASIVGNAFVTFDTLASLTAATWLPNGMVVQTKGYYAAGDGGAATYTISAEGGVVDGGSCIAMGTQYAKTDFSDGDINVRQFGAKGTVIADDTIAIQNALNYGGRIYVPRGVYTISKGLRPTSSSVLYGEKQSALRLKSGQVGDVWDKRFVIQIVNNTTDVLITGLTIDGNRDNVTNCFHCIGVDGADTSDITIEGNRIVNPQLDAVYIRAAQNINVLNNFSYNTGRSHYVITGGDNITIANNKGSVGYNTYVDIETNLATDTVENVTIRDNMFVAKGDCFADGFSCTGKGVHRNITVDNNFFILNRNFGGLSGVGTCENLSILNNTVYGFTHTSTAFLDCGDSSTGYIIKDNKMFINPLSTGTGHGLRARAASDISVVNNTIDNARSSAIQIEVGSTGGKSDNIDIEGNTVRNPKVEGIVVTAGCSNYRVTKNSISNSGGRGVSAYGINGEVSRNRVKDAFASSIYIANAENMLADANIITGGKEAINIINSKKSIVSKTISNGATVGVKLTNSTSIDVSHNILDKSTTVGLYQDALSKNCIISTNTVTNSIGFGINLLGSGNTVVNNRATDNQEVKTQTFGLRIAGDFNTIMGNDLRGNISQGISGSCANYIPKLDVFAQDMAKFNFL